MKLFLVAIAVIAAIHHGHGITLDEKTSACDLSDAFAASMQKAEDMKCDKMLTMTKGADKLFNKDVS